MADLKWDIKRGANVYHQVSDVRVKLWIKTGKIKAGESIVWHTGMSGWRRPEELAELRAFFKFAEKAFLKKSKSREFESKPFRVKKRIKSILIIDDEKDLCFLVGEALKSRGFQMEFAYTKRQALKRLNTCRPDLVLMDLRLPDGDGMALLSAIGKLTPIPAVIITTAFGNEDARRIAKISGVHGFFDKPYHEEDVIRWINEMHIPEAESGESESKTTGLSWKPS